MKYVFIKKNTQRNRHFSLYLLENVFLSHISLLVAVYKVVYAYRLSLGQFLFITATGADENLVLSPGRGADQHYQE